MKKLVGPFKQLLTMDRFPIKGALNDKNLIIIEDAGIINENERISQVGPYKNLKANSDCFIEDENYLEEPFVCIPGLIDAHTHICYAGTREKDYAMRSGGVSYLEIAKQGGGIWSTVKKTRNADFDVLVQETKNRANRLLNEGITTVEIKSGYCLNPEGEIKMLRAIKKVNENSDIDIIPTCLAAHIPDKDFDGTNAENLKHIASGIFPIMLEEKLSNRIDIFIEEGAFNVNEADIYLRLAKKYGFEFCIHADQFTTGGSVLAVKYNALSADHLEASGTKEIELLARSNTVAMALPGASIGLGVGFTPARKLLDEGACLAISSDWNPGSAPMGDLLVQTSILGMYEKLSIAEMLAGITFRAALALGLPFRGILKEKNIADFTAFRCNDYREIFYNQGKLKPEKVWKNGKLIRSTLQLNKL